MNEEQRSVEAAKNLPPSEPELNPQYPEPEDGGVTHGIPLADYVMTNEIMDYFNIGTGPRQTPEVREQMQVLLTYARQNAETPDLPSILRFLRHTEVILGSQHRPDRLSRLNRYVRIQQQKSLLAEKERALYG